MSQKETVLHAMNHVLKAVGVLALKTAKSSVKSVAVLNVMEEDASDQNQENVVTCFAQEDVLALSNPTVW